MIQISNPIELSSPQLINSNVDNVNRPDGDQRSIFQGPQKKNRLGVFAKLLEGLSAKLTRGTEESGGSDVDELSGLKSQKSNKKLLPNVKKPHNSSAGADLPNEDGLDAGLFLFPGQETSVEKAPGFGAGENLPWEAEPPGLNPGENKLDEIFPREAKLRDFKSKEDFHLFLSMMEKEGEGQDSALETANRAIGSGDGKQDSTEPGKAKSARNANVLNVSFREMEADALKSQSLAHLTGTNSGQKSEDAGAENGFSPGPRGKKGRERLSIEVRDLRTGNLQRAASPEAGGAAKEAVPANAKNSSATEIEIPVDLYSAEGSIEGSMDGGAREAGSLSTQGRTFEDLLAAQLRGDLSADIVRDATVIVRNGGEGTIRLSLRPASLGDVKIHLEMAENKITGHIIVESNDALKAFQRELPVLEKAFRDSGYSETSLDMSLAQNGDSGSHGQRQEGNFLTRALAASRYEAESYRFSTESDAPVSGTLINAGVLPILPGRTPVYMLV